MKNKAITNTKSTRTFHRLIGLIKQEYSIGERFLSVREIARHEGISTQTALGIVKRLRAEGILDFRPSDISCIKAIPVSKPPYRIVVFVPEKPHWFRIRFIEGIRESFGELVPQENLLVQDVGEMLGVDDVETLIPQGYDGYIGTARDYAWPFYALRQKGQQVLADICSPHWKSMPVTSVDFAATAEAAGSLFRQFGHRRACIVGTGHLGSNPDMFRRGFQGEQVLLVEHTHTTAAIERLRSILHTEKPTALYLPEKGYVPIVLSELATEGLKIPDDVSIVTHDGNPDQYEGFSVPPLTSVGPSIQTIGRHLAERMQRILEGSDHKNPLVQKIPASIKITGSIRRVEG